MQRTKHIITTRTHNPASGQLNFIYNLLVFVSISFEHYCPHVIVCERLRQKRTDKSEISNYKLLTQRFHRNSVVDTTIARHSNEMCGKCVRTLFPSSILCISESVSESKSKIEFPMWNLLNNWIYTCEVSSIDSLRSIQYCFSISTACHGAPLWLFFRCSAVFFLLLFFIRIRFLCKNIFAFQIDSRFSLFVRISSSSKWRLCANVPLCCLKSESASKHL